MPTVEHSPERRGERMGRWRQVTIRLTGSEVHIALVAIRLTDAARRREAAGMVPALVQPDGETNRDDAPASDHTRETQRDEAPAA